MNLINPRYNDVFALKYITFWLDISAVTERTSALFSRLEGNASHWEVNSKDG